jgi:hypothetical protein
MRRGRSLFAAAGLLLAAMFVAACGGLVPAGSTTLPVGASGALSAHDDLLAQAFAERYLDLQVEGEGTVVRLLSDDTQGGRHQRFILELASGQTLLVTHNIDVAPRVASLEVGDPVWFRGVYEWNDQGGLIHWTHGDPSGSHEAGWIRHEGTTYE